MPDRAANATQNSEKRFDRYSWITLAINLVILSFGAILAVASFQVPADGWIVDILDGYSNPVYLASLDGANPQLQPGDVVLEVEGQPIELLDARASRLKPGRPANWEAGRTVRYTVLREGSEVTVPVTLRPPPMALLYRQSIVEVLGSGIYLLIFGLLFALRPRLRASQLLFIIGVAASVSDMMQFGVSAPPGIADLLSPALYWPRIILSQLIWMVVIVPAMTHLFLIFPVPKRMVSRFPLAVPLIYGLPFAGSLLYVLASIAGFDVSDDVVGFLFAIPLTIIIALSLIHSLLTIKEPVPRMQIRWIAFGGLVGIVVLTIFGILQDVALQEIAGWTDNPAAARFWFGLIVLFIAAVFPISVAVAILRYRLWDIDIIINRSLVYGALTAVLALIYFGSVVLLQAIFQALTGQDSPVAIVISTLIIAALFSPLRRRVQNFIDRRFYRRKYDAQRILSRFAITARDQVDLDSLTDELTAVIQQSLEPETVSVWLSAPERRPAQDNVEPIGEFIPGR